MLFRKLSLFAKVAVAFGSLFLGFFLISPANAANYSPAQLEAMGEHQQVLSEQCAGTINYVDMAEQWGMGPYSPAFFAKYQVCIEALLPTTELLFKHAPEAFACYQEQQAGDFTPDDVSFYQDYLKASQAKFSELFANTNLIPDPMDESAEATDIAFLQMDAEDELSRATGFVSSLYLPGFCGA